MKGVTFTPSVNEAADEKEAVAGVKDAEVERCTVSRSSSYLHKLRQMHIPGYGTLDGEPHPPDRLGWLQRGYVINLVTELLTNNSAYCLLVFYMIIAPFCGNVNIDRDFPCDVSKNLYIHTKKSSFVCYYTKTYVWSFPHLCAATMLLTMGRDLIQKRFYYMLLKNGAVMSFMRSPLLRDTIVVVNLFAFAHFWAFVVLVALRLYMSGLDPTQVGLEAAKAVAEAASNPNGPASQRFKKAGTTDDPIGQQVLIQLLVFLGLPGCLFIMKLINNYDIEKTLVPLSEFVRDMTTGTENSPRQGDETDDEGPMRAVVSTSLSKSEIGSLVSVKDNCMRAFLDASIDEFSNPNVKNTDRYINLRDLYVAEGWHKLAKEPPRVQLVDALWPAPFVMARIPSLRSRSMGWSFPLTWTVYRVTALVFLTFFIIVQVLGLGFEILFVKDGKYAAVFSVPGELLNIFVLGCIWQRFWVARRPAERAVAAGECPP